MSSHAVPSYVRLKIDDEVQACLDIVHKRTGVKANPEMIRVALTYAAAGLEGPGTPQPMNFNGQKSRSGK